MLPGVRSGRDLTLDIGEDRLVVEARRSNLLLDIFLPYSLQQEAATAVFHTPSATLQIRMPLVFSA
jgi:hypothetical protein